MLTVSKLSDIDVLRMSEIAKRPKNASQQLLGKLPAVAILALLQMTLKAYRVRVPTRKNLR